MISTVAAQECKDISGGDKIKSDTLLCSDIYVLETGVEIIENDVNLDCNFATLEGYGLSTGAKIKSKENIIIKNCNFSNFESGIFIEKSKNITLINNIFSYNLNGIFISNSRDIVLENNTYYNNGKDVLNLTMEEEEQPPIEEQQQQTITQTELQIQQEHESNQLFSDLKQRFERYVNTSKENILLNRTFEYDEASNTTTVKIIISVSKEAVNFTYYEKIPKCFAIYAKEVVFKDTEFKVIHDDIIVRWDVSQISKEKIIEYAVNKKIFKDCEKLFEGFGFGERYEKTKKRNYAKNTVLILLSIIIIASVMFYQNKKIAKNKYVRRYKP